jgi:hypothetical protein
MNIIDYFNIFVLYSDDAIIDVITYILKKSLVNFSNNI